MTSVKGTIFLGLTIAFVKKVSGAQAPLKTIPESKGASRPKFGNYLVCPLSIEHILALVQIGATGITSTQISDAILLPHRPDSVPEAFLEMNTYLHDNKKYKLKSISKVFYKSDMKIKEKYKNTCANYFKADLEGVDFQAPTTKDVINKWVWENSDHTINNLIEAQSLSEDTCLVLVNIFAFKGKSANQFNPVKIGKTHFFINNEEYVDVDMLESVGYFQNHYNPIIKSSILRIPYEGKDIFLTIVLPNNKEGFSKMEAGIFEGFKQSTLDNANEPLQVRIPKCSLKSNINFNGVLQEMGVIEAFKDSSEMNGVFETSEPLKLTKVLHGTTIKIEEIKMPDQTVGSQISEVSSIPRTFQEPIKFYADHPFVFYLKHTTAGIFFLGRFYSVDGEIKRVKNDQPV